MVGGLKWPVGHEFEIPAMKMIYSSFIYFFTLHSCYTLSVKFCSFEADTFPDIFFQTYFNIIIVCSLRRSTVNNITLLLLKHCDTYE